VKDPCANDGVRLDRSTAPFEDLRTLLEWLRVGPNDEPRPDDPLVFLRESGGTVKRFRTA
jgi:hypothetical protein